VTTRVVATAGHVDHGKSTLIRALTGTDPDRLPEEKRRGLTIELGFARLELPDDGGDIHVIDVPGHMRFVGTMLAGVGALDGCLLVVAATEGWMPQSEEHLSILELLGVERGVVAVTMADLVEDDELERAVAGIVARTSDSFLRDAPVVPVDSVTGRGLDELVAALSTLPRGPAPPHGRTRLWIDRSFSIAGAGVVVTGTLTGAPLAVGDSVELVTRRGRRQARVRGLESFGSASPQLEPGRRAAVNLSGVDHHDLRRGDVLIEPGRWHVTSRIDVSLSVLAAAPRAVRSTGAHVVHIGSDEQTVRLQVLGARSIPPGQSGFARLHLARPVPLVPGDRYVLRDAGSSTTVGGGEVLDVDPVVRTAMAKPDRDVHRVIAERRWVDVDELERLTGQRVAATVERWVVDPAVIASARVDLHDAIDRAGPQGIDLAQLDERTRAVAQADDQLVVELGRVRRGGADDPYRSHPYLAALDASPFTPPSPSEAGASEADVRELVRRGLVIREEGVHFSPRAISETAAIAAELLAKDPDGFTVADLRRRLGTTRRFAVPLVLRLDHEGVTRRRGDRRIAGPRLPVADERSG
jgi:selenocysteine-specific elongation factor